MAGQTPLDNLLSQIPSAPVFTDKQNQVLAASAAKKAAMGMPSADDLYRLNAAIARGNMTADQRVMSHQTPADLLQKYGTDGIDMIRARSNANDKFVADQGATRSSGDILGDTVLSVGQGFGDSFLGLGALGAGLVNTKAGVTMSNLMDKFNNMTADKSSEGLKRHRIVNAADNFNDAAVSTEKYNKDLAAGDSKFVSSLSRIGRDAIDSVKRAASDPTILSDGVANAGGSLLAAGPMGKALEIGGGLTMRAAAKLGLSAEGRAASLITRAASKAEMPFSIGAQEAGGTYQQTVSSSLDGLKDRTDLNDAQKAEIANQAGLESAAVQFPVAAATGVMTGAFERHPFKVGAVGEAAGNITKEAVEEGIQSGSSQLATNLALRDNVNSKQDLAEGVGNQIGLGALYGAGSAGVVQVPHVAANAGLHAARGAVSLIADAGKFGYNQSIGRLLNRGAAVNAEIENQSPAAAARIDAERQNLVDNANQLHQNLAPNVQDNPELTSHLNNFFSNLGFSNDEANAQHPAVAQALQNSGDRFTAIGRAQSIAGDENAAPEIRVAAGKFLSDNIDKFNHLSDQDMSDELVNAIQDHPDFKGFEDISRSLNSLGQDPRVAQAINAAAQIHAPINTDQVSNDNIDKPEGQQAASEAVNLAHLVTNDMGSKASPKLLDAQNTALNKFNPDVADQILLHAENGKINLNDQDKIALKAASALARTEQSTQENAKNQGIEQTTFVSKQIRSDRSNAASNQPSLVQHTGRIISALQNGDQDIAADRLRRLMAFAEHMNNKVQALNTSYENGGTKESFDAYNPRTDKNYPAEGVTVHTNTKGADGSIRFAKLASLDANAVVTLANSLANAYPQLGIKPINPIDLHSDLNGKADAVVKKLLANQPKAKVTVKPNDAQTAPLQETNPAQIQGKAEPQSQSSAVQSDRTQSEQPAHAQTSSEATSQTEQTISDSTPSERAPKAQEAQQEQPVSETKPTAKQVEEAPKTTETATKEDRRHGIDAAYPNLIGSEKVRNFFKTAFKLPTEAISRLTGREDPIGDVRKALSSPTAFRTHVNSGELNNSKAELKANKLKNEDITAAYSKYLGNQLLGKAQQTIENRLDTELNKTSTEKRTGNNYSLKQLLLEGKEVNNFVRSRVFNLVEQNGDNLGYNQELLHGAVLAGFQWLLNADNRGRPLQQEDVAKILGVSEEQVDSETLSLFNQGIYGKDAILNLGNQITRFWGVQDNKDAPIGHTKGIPGAMAAEVIHGLEAAGLLKIINFDVNGKTYQQFELFPNENHQEMRNNLRNFPDAIEWAATTEPQETRFVGAPPTNIPAAQLRNPTVPLTKQQKQMVDNVQKQPHFINKTMAAFVSVMSQNDLLNLFGYGDLSKQKLNDQHRKSLESINTSLMAAYNTFGSYWNDAQNHADITGSKIDQVPIHFNYAITRVNRLMMDSPYNPQSNKLLREMILPTRSTLDLTNKAHQDLFWLGIAQALGVKIETKPRAQAIAEAQNKVATDYSKTMEVLHEWLGNGDIENSPALREDQINRIKNDFKGEPVSPLALHALMELARSKDQKQFTTSLYVEADGKTDGPINALVHLATSYFTPEWIQKVAKGGLFIGSIKKSLADHFRTDSVDLYETAKDFLKNEMDLKRQEANNPDSNINKHTLNATLRLMNTLLPGLTFDMGSGNLNIERGITKNPLTVTIYGAGIKGISNKVVDAMTDELYSLLSKIMNKETASQVDDLFGSEQNKLDFKSDFERLVGTQFKGDLAQFKMTPEMKENLGKNITRMFVQPMANAIEQTINETAQARTGLRKAVQVPSIFAKYAFQAEVDRMLADKAKNDPNWKSSDFLSQTELDQARNKIKMIFPMISTGTQNIQLGGSERVDYINNEVSRSLTNDLALPAYVEGPTNAGVSGIPGTVISVGDGQMIQNTSTDQNAPKNNLYIYDGVNTPLDTLENDSQTINKAVHSGWLNNPMESVSKMFDTFMKNADFSNLSENDKMVAELSRALLEDPADRLNADQVVPMLNELQQSLNNMSQEAQARKNVLSKLAMNVDHMAGAEAPHVTLGVDLSEMQPKDAAVRMNEMYETELAKLKKEKVTISENISKDVTNLGFINNESGVRVIPHLFLRDALRKMNIPSDQKTILAPVVNALQKSGVRIIFGNQSEIFDQARLDNVTVPSSDNGRVHGFFSTGSNTAYVINPSSETLTHELIHAATFSMVQAYYNNPESLSKPQRDAVARIDGLMNEWLQDSNAAANLNPNIQKAFYDAQQTVRNNLATNKAVAANEFMAWTLSNQGLTELAKNTKVKSPLLRVIGDALKALRTLLWGAEDRGPRLGNDLYSNLRFNTEILLEGDPNPVDTHTTLAHSSEFGTDDRLSQLRQALGDKILRYRGSQDNPGVKNSVSDEIIRIKTMADGVTDSFQAHGFPMTPQESSTFTALVSTFMTDVHLDPNTVSRIQEIYDHVIKQLTVESFLKDPETANENDRYTAQEKYNSIMGNHVMEFDDKGRSTLLPSFLALANTNQDFRSILNEMDLPKAEKLPNDTLDNILTNYGQEAMDRLGLWASGEKSSSPNVTASLDALTDHLAEIQQADHDYLALGETKLKPLGEALDKGNDWIAENLKNATSKGIDSLRNIRENSDNKWVKTATQFAEGMLAIFNEERAGDKAIGMVSFMNKSNAMKSIHDLMVEFAGRTKDNAKIYDLIKVVRSAVQQIRQQYVEKLPTLIQDKFTTKLEPEQWTHLFQSLGRTDIAALAHNYSAKEILEILSEPKRLGREISVLERQIASLDKAHWPTLQQKSKELAGFLNTGIVPQNLLRNAEAIARLPGERTATNRSQPSNDLVRAIDKLVSLYSYTSLDPSVKDSLSSLIEKEGEGVHFALSYLIGQRIDEQAKIVGPIAMMNHYKGHIPSPQKSGRSLIVAQDTEEAELRKRGFSRVADYAGSGAEFAADRRAYYYSPLSSRSPYQQGILQTVRQTASGVDPATGYTTDRMTAGRIEDPYMIKRVGKLMKRAGSSNENLMPIYNQQGDVIAYERSVDPKQELRLERNTNLSETLGIWHGRQFEEALANEFNNVLIDQLHDHWTNAPVDRRDEYINVFDPKELKKDPVLADSIKLIPPEVRNQIKNRFGEDGFMVRKDMLNNTLGYRAASISDAWTGITRFPPEMQKTVRNLASGVFGADAYKRMLQGESLVHNFVNDARVTIAVKSIIVPVSNFVSNIYQLSSRGVPMSDIIRAMPKKIAEVESYSKNRVQKIKLEAELRAAVNDVVKTRKINNEIQAIDDSMKRLSIWPLIQAGEFSSISDVGISNEDIELTEGRLSSFIDMLINKMPGGFKTAGRYAIIGKDTALFQGLHKAVNYGDFLAKTVLYDDLTKRQKMDPKDAMGRISEEYVNYDFLPGRTRSALENIGLLWFWNFKIRSTKIALSMIRNNPLHALMAGLAPAPTMFGSIGSPIANNLVTMGINGKLKYSIGPAMGIQSHLLLPWTHLID